MTRPAPDLNECVLRLDDLKVEIDSWTEYNFVSAFLTETDGFTFSIGDDQIPQGISGQIAPGQKVTLTVDGRPTCTGYLDEVHTTSSRGGTTLHVVGRDVFGEVVDSHINPDLHFEPTQTLEQVVSEVFGDFGFSKFIYDNTENRDLITGNKYGHKVNKTTITKRGRVTKSSGQIAKQFVAHQAKPYESEGAYAFCHRLASRNGQHIWPTADGTGVVLGKPDFDQEASFEIIRRRGIANGARNNANTASSARSRLHQPSVILARGRFGGGDFGRGAGVVIMVNELIARGTDGAIVPSVQKILARYPSAYVIGPADLDGNVSPLALNPCPRSRPVYLHDQDAGTLEELKNYVKREMARAQASSLTLTYEVDGHTQDGQTWAVDTIVSVDDDVANVHEDMWVIQVDFRKSRSNGTTSTIHLIRPWTLQF